MWTENKKNLAYYISLAKSGTDNNIDLIMADLNADMTIAASKIIDYALGFVVSGDGVNRMAHYLFNGTQIQRNYCALYFNRREDYPIVVAAYNAGLIDGIQAFSR